MKFNVISLFPELFSHFLKLGVVGQAYGRDLFSVDFVNPRDFTEDVHKTVDDRPFGGSDGMLFKFEPLKKALESLPASRSKVVYLSPQGALWDDQRARSWADHMVQGECDSISLICGRYAGIDHRLVEEYVDEEISIGDYVLSGGEVPAMVLMESLVRFLPGTLGNQISSERDSFSEGLLECPQWTRPRVIEGREDLRVPDILLSGDHSKIQEWTHKVSLLRTYWLRPQWIQNSEKLNLEFLEALAWGIKQEELTLRSVGLSKELLKSWIDLT